jgi:hypothetical protein
MELKIVGSKTGSIVVEVTAVLLKVVELNIGSIACRKVGPTTAGSKSVGA